MSHDLVRQGFRREGIEEEEDAQLSPVASSHPLGAKRQQVTLWRGSGIVCREKREKEKERDGDGSEMGGRVGLHII